MNKKQKKMLIRILIDEYMSSHSHIIYVAEDNLP